MPLARSSVTTALLGCLLASAIHATDALPIPVLAQPLSALTSPPQYSAPASVKPLNRPQLAAEVTGRVIRMPVNTGELVKAGDLLVELDCQVHQLRARRAEAARTRSQAQLSFAKTQLKRAENLKSKRTISDELLEQRRTEVATANTDLLVQRSDLALAKLDVQRCLITAPFDALLSRRLASVGSLANPGTPLVELVQVHDLEVSAELRDYQADRLQSAAKPFFEYLGQQYPLTLRSLPALVDERSRTREARLQFTDRTAPVGAAGRLIWQTAQQQLPADYLVRRDKHLGVFVVDSGIARFVAVPGAREGQPATVQLEASTQIVTEGRQRLNDGDRITMSPVQ